MAKSNNKVSRIVRQKFLDARETIIRQGEVNMVILSNVLGLTPGGDMKEFMRDTVRDVKKIKRV